MQLTNVTAHTHACAGPCMSASSLTAAARCRLQVWDVPAAWSLRDAATVPVAYLTAYYSLVMRGGLVPAHRVLVHSGTGAVGLAAIRIALNRGCEARAPSRPRTALLGCCCVLHLHSAELCCPERAVESGAWEFWHQSPARLGVVLRAACKLWLCLALVQGHMRPQQLFCILRACVKRVWAGQVFATCGSERKRRYLLDTFPGLREDHIGDSRSTSFEAMIKHMVQPPAPLLPRTCSPHASRLPGGGARARWRGMTAHAAPASHT